MKIKFAPLRSIKCFSDPIAKLDRAKVPGSCPKSSRILASLQHTPFAPPSYVTMYRELLQRNFITSNRYSNSIHYAWTFSICHVPSPAGHCSSLWANPLDALAKNVPSPFSICEPKIFAPSFKKTWTNKTKAFLVVSGCVRDYPIDLVSFIRSARLQPLQVASFLGEEHLFGW